VLYRELRGRGERDCSGVLDSLEFGLPAKSYQQSVGKWRWARVDYAEMCGCGYFEAGGAGDSAVLRGGWRSYLGKTRLIDK